MRLWSVHPRHLDRQGLTACWREGLLAQKVLTGTTRGYRNHPQLTRFRPFAHAPVGEVPGPVPGPVRQPRPDGAPSFPLPEPGVHPGVAVVTYLHAVVDEAAARGYSYDRSKLAGAPDSDLRIEVTDGQLAHEWAHLLAKLALRSPEVHARWYRLPLPQPHPLFVVVPGPVADWEVLSDLTDPPG